MDSYTILDRVLTTESDRVGDVCVLESVPRCHHCPVIFEYILQFVLEDSGDSTRNHFIRNKGKILTISIYTLAVDWVTKFDGRSINDVYLIFCKFFLIPVRQICSNRKTGLQAGMNENSHALFNMGEGCKVEKIQRL